MTLDVYGPPSFYRQRGDRRMDRGCGDIPTWMPRHVESDAITPSEERKS